MERPLGGAAGAALLDPRLLVEARELAHRHVQLRGRRWRRHGVRQRRKLGALFGSLLGQLGRIGRGTLVGGGLGSLSWLAGGGGPE